MLSAVHLLIILGSSDVLKFRSGEPSGKSACVRATLYSFFPLSFHHLHNIEREKNQHNSGVHVFPLFCFFVSSPSFLSLIVFAARVPCSAAAARFPSPTSHKCTFWLAVQFN